MIKLSGLVGFPIQNITQENQNMLSKILESNVEILHVDISDGFAGIESDIKKTKILISKIIKLRSSKILQLHFFVSSEIIFKTILKNTFRNDVGNIEIFVHINYINIKKFDKKFFLNNFYFSFDVNDILNGRISKKLFFKNKMIICLESKLEPERGENLIKACEIIRLVNNDVVITVDRSVVLNTLIEMSTLRDINVICGSLLKEDINKGYVLMKGLLNSY